MIKEIMEQRNMTAYRVGKMTGIPANLVAAYVSGEKLPGYTNIIKLCDALNCTADELLGRKGT